MKWTAIINPTNGYQRLGTYKSMDEAKTAIEREVGKKLRAKRISNEEYEIGGKHLALTMNMAGHRRHENLKEGMMKETTRMTQLAGCVNEAFDKESNNKEAKIWCKDRLKKIEHYIKNIEKELEKAMKEADKNSTYEELNTAMISWEATLHSISISIDRHEPVYVKR